MKQNKAKAALIGGLMLLLCIALAFFVPSFVKEMKAKHLEKINGNLQEIYIAAQVIDDLEGGILNDSDNRDKYLALSEKTGFEVYNVKKKNKYSLQKDYKTGEITVFYGEEIHYPQKNDASNSIDGELKNEDLFAYDESTGKVIIIGFSEQGKTNLTSSSAVQIPETYKGRPVVGIAEKAFYSQNLQGTVVIPESIKTVGRYAFSNNGKKADSENIGKPYAGTWKLKRDKWEKIQ